MYGASFIQAARGPVMLITLGILLAIHQNTAWGFEQTFPVLIIVFGIMKLLERGSEKSDPMQPPPPFPTQGGQI
jgi:hypothetical protein